MKFNGKKTHDGERVGKGKERDGKERNKATASAGRQGQFQDSTLAVMVRPKIS